MAKNKTVKKTNFYECKSCDKDSVRNPAFGACPCPRGGCEAVLTGKVIVTTEIIRNPKKKTVKKTSKTNKKVDSLEGLFKK